jgi:hypothetical protein
LKGIETFVNGEDIVEIRDITEFVAEQSQTLQGDYKNLLQVPVERVYAPRSEAARKSVAIDLV